MADVEVIGYYCSQTSKSVQLLCLQRDNYEISTDLLLYMLQLILLNMMAWAEH